MNVGAALDVALIVVVGYIDWPEGRSWSVASWASQWELARTQGQCPTPVSLCHTNRAARVYCLWELARTQGQCPTPVSLCHTNRAARVYCLWELARTQGQCPTPVSLCHTNRATRVYCLLLLVSLQGMVLAAEYIKKKIENERLLEKAFHENVVSNSCCNLLTRMSHTGLKLIYIVVLCV